MEEVATERSFRIQPPQSCKERVSLLEVQSLKVFRTKINRLLMFFKIGKLRIRKKIPLLESGSVIKYFQTHMFGYLITCVWICFLPVIKGHPCDPNEATQLVNYLMHYK